MSSKKIDFVIDDDEDLISPAVLAKRPRTEAESVARIDFGNTATTTTSSDTTSASSRISKYRRRALEAEAKANATARMFEEAEREASAGGDGKGGRRVSFARPAPRRRHAGTASSFAHNSDSHGPSPADAVEAPAVPSAGPAASGVSLLEQAAIMHERGLVPQLTEEEKRAQEEAAIASELQSVAKPLRSVAEIATGENFAQPIVTGWEPPKKIRNLTAEQCDKIRHKLKIDIAGHLPPPPIKKFRDMRLPSCILRVLESKGIKKPSPIQVQGIPTILSGRDMIGVSYTGSGKTLVFVLPAVMLALEADRERAFVGHGRGPFAVIMAPSRELASQTADICKEFARALSRDGFPELNVVLVMGGRPEKEQLLEMKGGVHIVVATPGRLLKFLDRNQMNLRDCRYICLDEADRLIDLGFEEDIRNVFDHFKHRRQTLLFSATMPTRIQAFAESALIDPVHVDVGRAGAASLNVIQEVEEVEPNERMLRLLDCLQKTGPPVLIFSANKNEVDDIHEYLLVKGVEAVAIHGGKDQEERSYAVQSFREGRKDVLVASDVASKGLDFPEIKHVINFDMPNEIENYVHRVGRTGRGGKTGVATTFVSTHNDVTALLDLKHLLLEAKQRVPPILMAINDPRDFVEEGAAGKSCANCGGLGHSVMTCPKLAGQRELMIRRATRANGGTDW